MGSISKTEIETLSLSIEFILRPSAANRIGPAKKTGLRINAARYFGGIAGELVRRSRRRGGVGHGLLQQIGHRRAVVDAFEGAGAGACGTVSATAGSLLNCFCNSVMPERRAWLFMTDSENTSTKNAAAYIW